jgi:putative GTP pyrophosphokinase
MIILYTVNTIHGPKELSAEIQIRTMAMNFWATIEHSLQYKYKENIPEYIQQKLLDASEAIIEVDHEMSDVRDEIMDAQNSHRKKETLVKDILNNIQNLYKVANQREVTKIQDEFYKVYVLDDMLQLKHFARQLDIISEGYRAQSL